MRNLVYPKYFFEIKKGVAFIRQRLLILLINQSYCSEGTTSYSRMAAKFGVLLFFVKATLATCSGERRDDALALAA